METMENICSGCDSVTGDHIGGYQTPWPFRSESWTNVTLKHSSKTRYSRPFRGVRKDSSSIALQDEVGVISHPGHLSTRVPLLPSAACLILNNVQKLRSRAACEYKGAQRFEAAN
jgi:hypothetical protein